MTRFGPCSTQVESTNVVYERSGDATEGIRGEQGSEDQAG